MTPYDHTKALETAERLIQASDGGYLHSGMKDIVEMARCLIDLDRAYIKLLHNDADDWYPYE